MSPICAAILAPLGPNRAKAGAVRQESKGFIMSQLEKMQALCVEQLADDYAGVVLRQIDIPSPAADEVLVRIGAATLGFPDLLMTRGAYQHKPDLPFIMGGEAAGEIVACGSAVTGFAVGERVAVGKIGGGFAGYGCYKAATIRRCPETLSLAQAAALSAAYLTAYVALVRRAHVQAGEWVLVHGAAGGVGLAAVDLAKALGARVIATSPSQDKLDQIDALYKPDVCLNSTNGFRDAVKEITGGGADVVYDPVGGDVFDESVRCIAWNGRLLVIGFASGRIPSIGVNMPLIKGFSVVGVRAGEYGRRDPDKGAENLDAIWDMAARGIIRPHVCAEVQLADWRQAFEMMSKRAVIGRVVLCP
jgi:NADPH2:quinone reductase